VAGATSPVSGAPPVSPCTAPAAVCSGALDTVCAAGSPPSATAVAISPLPAPSVGITGISLLASLGGAIEPASAALPPSSLPAAATSSSACSPSSPSSPSSSAPCSLLSGNEGNLRVRSQRVGQLWSNRIAKAIEKDNRKRQSHRNRNRNTEVDG